MIRVLSTPLRITFSVMLNDDIELFSFVNFGWFAKALWIVDGTRPS